MPDDRSFVSGIGNRRALELLYFFAALVFVIGIRLLFLQVFEHNYFLEKSMDQRLRFISLSPDRGDIFDRNGNLLATSINAYSVFTVPRNVENKKAVADVLSKQLNMSRYSVMEKLNSEKPFVWIKRKIEEPVAQKLIQKKLPGIGFISEKKRVYPKKRLASSVIGFVGTDNQGLSGIEISYDRYLKGEPGKLTTERDNRGMEIMTSNLRVLESATDGMNITLTLDEPTQYLAEQKIRKAVTENHAKSGCIIVMNTKTGELLALASYPDFDPNEFQRFKPEVLYSRVVSDVYEPGSTFKLVTVASAIEEGAITKNSTVYCPDKVEVGGKIIRNSHKLKFPTRYLSIADILKESVNIGVVQIAQKMGKEKFYRHIKDFGFGESTDVGLAGESRGILSDVKDWNKPDIAMISFGQGIAVTPIQLISSLSSLANKGRRVKPYLVKNIESVDKSFVKAFVTEDRGQVVSQDTARDIMDLSRLVVEKGTGRLAQIPDFQVGGKTGTAQKALPNGEGYIEGHYISSFIGFAPLSDPRLAVLVVVDDPYPKYWGETVAAPACRDLMEFSLRRFNIPPDKPAKAVI